MMSQSIPPAPLPPLPASGCLKLITPASKLTECSWAVDYPELQKACFLARVCEYQTPRCCRFHNIPSILQEGPTCGLTALSMLLGGEPSPHALLQTAKELHYTHNGEMFSAQNLFQLIRDTLQLPTIATLANNELDELEEKHLKNVEMHEGPLNCAKVRNCLLAGACLFVPYDPDFNHTPCLKFGHKAHWALIIGYLISETDEFHVLARHGKAKNLAVWTLDALSKSNSNLIEFAQPKGYPNCDFLLPPGGIGGDLGLRERAIIVSGLSHETITVR